MWGGAGEGETSALLAANGEGSSALKQKVDDNKMLTLN